MDDGHRKMWGNRVQMTKGATEAGHRKRNAKAWLAKKWERSVCSRQHPSDFNVRASQSLGSLLKYRF